MKLENLTEQEIQMLKDTKSSKEWTTACDRVKAARGGQYPPDWWPVMKLSGLMDKIFAGWDVPSSTEIKITTL